MGLASSQIRLLTLTARKADCEYGIAINSIEKMALTKEQSKLSKEYQSRLQSKQISYYDNGNYYKMNYSYLMGYGADFSPILSGNKPLKDTNSMILCDYKGQVVLSDKYASAITKVLGSSAMGTDGRGGTFSADKIPEILAALFNGYTAEQFETIIDGKNLDVSFAGSGVQNTTGEETGNCYSVNISTETSELLSSIVDFYYPIFQAAAANGWTTEYNKEMANNDDYISDAIASGSFQLESVQSDGNYEPGTSLTYFVTNGSVVENTSSEARAEITAWYEAEKAKISEKEDWLDIENQDLSTELEAINAEIQSVQSLIDDAVSSVFDWGSS